MHTALGPLSARWSGGRMMPNLLVCATCRQRGFNLEFSIEQCVACCTHFFRSASCTQGGIDGGYRLDYELLQLRLPDIQAITRARAPRLVVGLSLVEHLLVVQLHSSRYTTRACSAQQQCRTVPKGTDSWLLSSQR